jgi:hypothetical protein
MLKKKFDRKKMKEGGKKSQERSYRTKDAKSISGAFSFNIEQVGLPIYKPISDSEKSNKVIFLLWLPGDKDPIQGSIPEDQRDYTHILDFWDHSITGVGRFVCLLNTYGKKCPICEYLKSNRTGNEDDDRQLWLKYKPTRRAVYAVWDMAEKNAGPKVWYAPYNFIEAKVQGQARDPETGETIYYTDPDEGCVVFFKFIDKGNYQHEYKDFVLKPFKEPVPDDILEKVPALDEFLVVPTYDEVRLAFDPNGTAVVEQTLDNLGSKVVEKEKDVVFELSNDDEDEEDEEDFDVEEVKPKQKTKQNQKKQKNKIICPADGEFGAEFNEYEECDDCDFFEECSKEYDRLNDDIDYDDEQDEENDFELDKPKQKIEEEKKTVRKPLRRKG